MESCRARFMGSQLLLLAALLVGVRGQKTSSANCTVSMPPQFFPKPNCLASDATIEDAKAVAWMLAPVVHFHPLETWYLQDMDKWYEAATLFLPDNKPLGESAFDNLVNSTLEWLMLLPKSFKTLLNSTGLPTREDREALLKGAPFDVNGNSTAKVFYTVLSFDEGTWLFNFNLFYSWNGCSNQDFVLNTNGATQVLEYLMCPIGVHEGDLEHISMLVCKSGPEGFNATKQIQQLAYSQHGWHETRDCTQGQCVFDSAGHPITYAGLESHSNNFVASPLQVYEYVNGSIPGTSAKLSNLGGIWVGDRTLVDQTKRFYPREDNILHMPWPNDIVANWTANSSKREYEWAMYPGNWGAGRPTMPTLNLSCFYNNQTVLEECTENPSNAEALNLLRIAINVLGGIKVFGTFEGETYQLVNSTNTSVPAATITGPLYRPFSYLWPTPQGAPIHDRNIPVLTCPQDVEAVEPIPSLKRYSNGIDTLINYLWGVAVGAFCFSLAMDLVFALPSIISGGDKITASLGRGLRSIAVELGSASDATKAAWKNAQAKVRGASASAAKASQRSTQSAAGSNVNAGSKRLDSESGLELHPSKNSGTDVAAEASAAPTEPKIWSGDSSTFVAGEEVSADLFDNSDVVGVVGTRQKAQAAPTGGSRRHFLWGTLAVGLFVAGIVLLSLGLNTFWTNSVASFATDLLGKSGIMYTIKVLLATGMALVGLCDLVAFILLFLADGKYIQVGKFRVRNYLGGLAFALSSSYTVHIVIIGLVILVINVAAILFALGYLIIIAQVAVRVACTSISSIDVVGLTVDEVCISVPTVREGDICGWDALQMCFEVTNMNVANIVLGAIMLLWSHLIWLLMLTMQLWRFYEIEVEVAEEKEGGQERR